MAIRQDVPGQKRAVKGEKPLVVPQERILDSRMEIIRFKYMRGGQEVVNEVIVPKALLHAMVDPGESKLGPLEAMRQLADFYEKNVSPDLQNVVLTGEVSVPASALSSLIQGSYSKHAVVAADAKQVRNSLFLEDTEVDRMLRMTAALLTGMDVEQIRKLSLDETTVMVNRTVTSLEQTTTVTLKTKRLMCDAGSHREERAFTVPDGTDVKQAQVMHEQRIANLPKVRDTLEDAFSKIAELRGGQLDPHERNAVVAHMNINYIKDPQNRLPIVP